MVIKPCTETEVAFYQSANASNSRLAYFMPQFFGTLELTDKVKSAATSAASTATTGTAGLLPTNGLLQLEHIAQPHTATSQPLAVPSPLLSHLQLQSQSSSKASSRPPSPDPTRLKGKAIATDTYIVLSALTSGFKRPNILDLKLGSRLWADDASLAKRTRLDKVSQETTSSSLGFRVAGMRVWKGIGAHSAVDLGAAKTIRPPSDRPSTTSAQKERRHDHIEYDEENNYLVYNKLYGRAVDSAQIIDAFKDYFIVPSSGIHRRHALELIASFKREIQEIYRVLESVETRMYSSSILLVYEGDPEAYEETLELQRQKRAAEENGEKAEEGDLDDQENEEIDAQLMEAMTRGNATTSMRAEEEGEEPVTGNDDEGEEEEEEEEERRTYALKLIDFAHASWTPGQGPDRNVLRGVRSTITVLEDLEKQLIDDG